jgi:hypothetical protein
MSRVFERMSRTGYRTGSRGCCMSRYSLQDIRKDEQDRLQDRQQRLLHELDSLQD